MGGGFLGGIFGGNQPSYEAPEVPQMETAPVREEAKEAESKASRESERRKLRARTGGVNGTLLSNPLGGTGGASGLLGRTNW